MRLWQILVDYINEAIVFKIMDCSSIAIERLFSSTKRAMTDDRKSMGNAYFEAILVCKSNPDILKKSKQYLLDLTYKLVMIDE